MVEAKFKIDDIDRSIINLLQENPHLTHMEIAKKVDRSQPTIGMRISKLEERGLLAVKRGVNFKQVSGLYLASVTLKTKDPEEIFLMAKECPFIINCFKLSGENNIYLLLTSSSLDKLDTMVNYHFRRNSNISNIVMEIVVDMAKDFILPVDFRIEDQNPTEEEGCGEKCVRRIKRILETQSEKA